MIRNTLLFLSTVAALGVLFLGYQWLLGPGTGDATLPMDFTGLPDAQSREAPVVSINRGNAGDRPDRKELVQQVGLAPGQEVAFTIYDPRTSRPTQVWRAARWTNVPDVPDAVDVEQPRVALLLPNGALATLTAERGRVTIDQSGGQVRPMRGKLAGVTELLLQRVDSVSAAPAPDAAPLARITLHDVEFDADAGYLRAAGAVRAVSPRAEIEGEGLELIWNRDANRIEQLTLARGKQLLVRGGILPGAAPSSAPAPGPDPATQRAAPPPPGTNETGYYAQLDGPVTAEQHRGGTVVGKLSADVFQFLFDAGGRSDPLTPREDAPASAPTAAAPAADAEQVVIRWEGPLRLSPADARPARAAPRQRLVARGERVEWSSAEATMVCGRLEYHAESERLWLAPLGATPVVMQLQNRLDVRAAEIFADPRSDRITLVGPLSLRSRERSDSGSLRIDCDQLAELRIARREKPAGGAGDALSSLAALSGAEFQGAVDIDLGQRRRLRSDRLEAFFRPAVGDEPIESLLDRAAAAGAVRFNTSTQTLTCDRLDIAFARDEAGRTYVNKVDARDAVRIRDTRSDFAAAGARLRADAGPSDELLNASIEGRDRRPAVARAGSYTVHGRTIDFDPRQQALHVPGDAYLRLESQRSMRGFVRSSAAPTTIQCNDGLRVDGRANRVTFSGKVYAVTGRERLFAESLELLLEDARPTDRSGLPSLSGPLLARRFIPGAAVSQAAWRLWSRFDAGTADSATATPGVRVQNLRKEPLKLIARQVLVQSGNLDAPSPEDRVEQRIAAPEMDVDLRTRVIRTTGRTTLELIDQRGAAAAPASASSTGLPSALVSSGPGQTAMVAERGLTYRLGEGAARRDSALLEGRVRVRHVTGGRLSTLGDLVPPAERKPDDLARLGGRNFYAEAERIECVLTPAPGNSPAVSLTPDRETALRLETLTTEGATYVRDEQGTRIFEIQARRIEFERATSRIRVFGETSRDALVSTYDQIRKASAEARSREIHVDLTSNTVRAVGPTSGSSNRP